MLVAVVAWSLLRCDLLHGCILGRNTHNGRLECVLFPFQLFSNAKLVHTDLCKSGVSKIGC